MFDQGAVFMKAGVGKQMRRENEQDKRTAVIST